ncbi:hypothetical protein M758_10G004600 [Ceratodon purpureus]|nr:hypothetical protein M758_10G004600 [Ceratodon purpureus]
MYIYTLHHLCTQITQGAGKSYIKHLTSENLDTWVERRGIRPLLATNIDMYRAGHMPVSTTESPPSTQQLLQPHPQSHGTRASPSVKLQDAAILCQPSSSYFNSNTSPSVMSRIKELGMQEDMKRKWPPAGSEGLDHSPLWLRREQDPQMVPKLSPALPVVSAKINPNSMSAQSKQYSMSRLFQEISQAEIPGKQWSNVINQARSDLTDRHNVAVASPCETTAFMHDRNASASPSEHAMSEDHTSSVEFRQAGSPDVELKRTGSISSEDFVDLDSTVRGGRGRSLPRNSDINTVSKNLVSERKRRKKLNDGLYSLRALVPKISKMDKASIVGDAIEHVKELQQQIETIESEIAEMESKRCANIVDEDSGGSMLSESGKHAAIAVSVSGICEVVEAAAKPMGEVAANDNSVTVASTADVTSADSQGQPPVADQKTILKMDVAKLEDQTYQLQISCQRAPGVLVQLTQALESLDLDVLNAYHTSFQESILNTFIVEMKNLNSGEAEDVRSSLLDAVAQHGLVH